MQCCWIYNSVVCILQVYQYIAYHRKRGEMSARIVTCPYGAELEGVLFENISQTLWRSLQSYQSFVALVTIIIIIIETSTIQWVAYLSKWPDK